MTTNYTPGPWKANRVLVNNEPDRAMIHQGAWGGDAIADLGTFERYNPHDGYLIAAAPELLEALKAVEARLTAVARAFYVDGKAKALKAAFDGWKDDIDPARAAIAKAEGQQ